MEAVGILECQVLIGVNYPSGISTPVLLAQASSLDTGSGIPSELFERSCTCAGSGEGAQEENSGSCPRPVTGFLQPPPSSGEGHRRLETGHRFVSREQVHLPDLIQDENSDLGPVSYQGGRLHGLNRPLECLLPSSHPQSFEQGSYSNSKSTCPTVAIPP